MTEYDWVDPAEWGPLEKPYTYLPEYADVAYVDGKLSVARGILSRTTDPERRSRWMQTVDILLAQRAASNHLMRSFSGEAFVLAHLCGSSFRTVLLHALSISHRCYLRKESQ